MVEIPSPAIAVVGRHNSGKTTLVVKLISEMVSRGFDVGSIKHHHHGDFGIDHPGKDSYRHREAGASETVIASPGMMARVKTLYEEMECSEILNTMPGHDIVIVEGYRKSGLPTIEIMRAANEMDSSVAEAFAARARNGEELAHALTVDDVQAAKAARGDIEALNLIERMPASNTVAVVTDIPCAREAAGIYGIPCFNLDGIASIADFLEHHYTRPRVSVVIQAGGESRRMGQSKALVDFQGRPLIMRLVERLLPAADELVITTNEGERLAFLHDEFPEANIRLAPDEYDFRGALPGLYTALNAASNPFVAVVACDMLFASPRLIVAEAIEMAELDCDVVVPVNQHGYEPFHAMYRKGTCIKAVKSALDDGRTRAQAFFSDGALNVVEFPQARVLEVEPRGGCFINANTPEELASISSHYPAS